MSGDRHHSLQLTVGKLALTQVPQFNAINRSTEGARSTGNMATLCGQQAGVINLPVQRIEHVVQPTAQQQSTFDELKKAAQKAGGQLQSSCPTEVPKWPVARLDTVATRVRLECPLCAKSGH